ncbi:2-isopropylmalate synthase [Leucogyrophana mollusca]|uniref:2-isopropylmalate synthase n=1 Tax=Leucogyrophana mollusca TaxID=85980 RepID=A0ACB8B9W7_9AGAM|nr:2-isopropylmalate synthase [Leucogyrophana mollusca]
MPMLANPSDKYEGYVPLSMPDRQWPGRVTKAAPIWLSTDLRDGNQALVRPMTIEQKSLLFKSLIRCGFKEIEVAFPSASETEFAFTRKLIEENEIPDGVWIQVMAPARGEYIKKTFEATRGTKHVIIQLYTNTATLFREVILGYTKEEILRLTVEHTHVVWSLAKEYSSIYGTSFRLCYGAEGFSQSDLDFLIKFCTQLKNTWEADGRSEYPVIFNLPSTVECAPANHFADQVEYFCRNMPNREEITVCVHAHNDRGTAVSATELALLAGADRVDGCLFGNGERTGNVDIVTLALNSYSQGIPGLDFSDLKGLTDVARRCTDIPIYPRQPHAGDSAHQDGIRKGFRAMAERHAKLAGTGKPKMWAVPYLPVDRSDFGLSYKAVRVNSQSGKSGIAHLVEQALNLDLPRPIQIAFYKTVQDICDAEARELTVDEIALIFRRTYHFCHDGTDTDNSDPVQLRAFNVTEGDLFEGILSINDERCSVRVDAEDVRSTIVSAVNQTGGHSFRVERQELPAGMTATYAWPRDNTKEGESGWWGIGTARDATGSMVRSVISALNCALDNYKRKDRTLYILEFVVASMWLSMQRILCPSLQCAVPKSQVPVALMLYTL